MAENILGLQTTVDTLTIERDSIFRKIQPLNKQLDANYEKLKKAKEKLANFKAFTTGFTDEELLHYNPLTESDTLYKAQQKFFKEYGLHNDGYLPATEKDGVFQRGFSVCFYRNDGHPKDWTVAQQIDKVIEFMDKYHSKILPMKDGTFYIGVFEHTLSEYGIYTILVNFDLKTAKLQKTTYGHTETLREGTFKEILELAAKKHYYE